MTLIFLSFADTFKPDESLRLESNNMEDRSGLPQQSVQELLSAVENWTDSLEDKSFPRPGTKRASLRSFSFSMGLSVKLLCKILSLFQKWKWGTMLNFFYKKQGEMQLS